MTKALPADSVGIVKPQTVDFDEELELQCGRTLKGYRLVFETYGELNAARDNAVLVCHSLSGDHHAAGRHSIDDRKPGWWDALIGPGKAMDSDRFFIVSPNNLGGCSGSSGPVSLNPESGKPYGRDFPFVTCRDWVRSQRALRNHLGIDRWYAVAGGSLGGMQAMQWALDYPGEVDRTLLIAAAPFLSAQNIAFSEIARQAILTDPDYCEGAYAVAGTKPSRGLTLARMLGHITYLSDDAMGEKFGRELRKATLNFSYDIDFQVESYLRYQGSSFAEKFDANTYLLMTKALDYFNPAAEAGGDLVAAIAPIQAKTLVVSFTTDWRFSPQRSREIVEALIVGGKDVSYIEIASPHGHDSFLMPIPLYTEGLARFLASEKP